MDKINLYTSNQIKAWVRKLYLSIFLCCTSKLEHKEGVSKRRGCKRRGAKGGGEVNSIKNKLHKCNKSKQLIRNLNLDEKYIKLTISGNKDWGLLN